VHVCRYVYLSLVCVVTKDFLRCHSGRTVTELLQRCNLMHAALRHPVKYTRYRPAASIANLLYCLQFLVFTNSFHNAAVAIQPRNDNNNTNNIASISVAQNNSFSVVLTAVETDRFSACG